ncbi:class I adenylate-forming enzyme family protein [Microbulbifer sp. YPW1]|uniref:class I adenylate-forming enzyme family protein n=1 Tax=Microbulbifer sp. YPW1 TaxID=2745199 RepID=UPI0015975DB1|nr:AMP-binding protein [Microbulbifer sp. YPW1]QKX17208.1 AMP-binding protein [Microbulbifer sp. YPW1]
MQNNNKTPVSLQQQVEKYQQAVAHLTQSGQPFEIAETRRDSHSVRYYKSAPANLAQLYQMMLAHGDKEFLVSGEQRLSFREVYQQACAFALGLQQQLGVKKGDKVAIAMRNNPQWCIAFLAITAMGAVVVPLNSWWTGEELIYALKDAGADIAVVDGERAQRILGQDQGQNIHLIHVAEPGGGEPGSHTCVDYASLLQEPADSFPSTDIDPEDEASIFYTSGSTGNPKGALSTHRGIVSALMSWALMSVANHAAGLGEDLTDPNKKLAALVTVPFFHVTGSHAIFLLSIASGRKLVLMHKWDPKVALELIERERITYFNGVPTMSQDLLNHPEFAQFDTSSLEEVFAGGAARPAAHALRIHDEFGLNAGGAYGLTETNGLGCVISGAMYQARPSSVGMVTPNVTELKIADENGAELPAGETGEICFRGPANIVGYWKNTEATAKSFDNGWFKTGDVGYRDELGFLYIVDRIKDIIIRGGENISCLEVESALYQCPDVLEVGVVGIADERLGEAVGAVVYTDDGQQDADAIRDFLKGHLAQFKIPQEILFSDEPLPRTASGKIHKPALREIFAQAISA